MQIGYYLPTLQQGSILMVSFLIQLHIHLPNHAKTKKNNQHFICEKHCRCDLALILKVLVQSTIDLSMLTGICNVKIIDRQAHISTYTYIRQAHHG